LINHQFRNAAMLMEETVMDVVLVVDHDWPAGPSFLSSLTALCEAVVLHEHVYFDAQYPFLAHDQSRGNDVHSVLLGSPLVKCLLREGVIKRCPSQQEMDGYLARTGREYTSIDFAGDAAWLPRAFSWSQPSGELKRYRALLDLLPYPDIFDPDFSVDREEGLITSYAPAALMAMTTLGFTFDDLVIVEAYNHRATAYASLTRNLGVSLFTPLTAGPHYVGSVNANNSRARRVYQQISDHAEHVSQEASVGDAIYTKMLSPPLCRLVLGRCLGDKKRLGDELARLRNEHATFRKYLGSVEETWQAARSIQSRKKAMNEFDNAWKALLEKQTRPTTRWIYTLWDILKDPTKMLVAIGDKLVVVGKEQSVIGRARGMSDFQAALLSGPVAEVAEDQFVRTFPRLMDDDVWDAGRAVAKELELSLMTKGPR